MSLQLQSRSPPSGRMFGVQPRDALPMNPHGQQPPQQQIYSPFGVGQLPRPGTAYGRQTSPSARSVSSSNSYQLGQQREPPPAAPQQRPHNSLFAQFDTGDHSGSPPPVSPARKVVAPLGEQIQHGNKDVPRAPSSTQSYSASIQQPVSIDATSMVPAKEAFERVAFVLEENASDKGSQYSKVATKSNLSTLLAAAAVLLQDEPTETPQKQTKEQTRALLVLLRKLQADLDDQQKNHEIAMKKLQAYVDSRFDFMEKAFEDGLKTVSSQALFVNERATKFAQLGEALELSLNCVETSKERRDQSQARFDKLEQEVQLLKLSIVGASRMNAIPQGSSMQIPCGTATQAKLNQDAVLKGPNVQLPKAGISRVTLALEQDSCSETLETFPQDHHLVRTSPTATDHLSTFSQATSSATPYAVGDLLSRLRQCQPSGVAAQSGNSSTEPFEPVTASKSVREANKVLSSFLRPSVASMSKPKQVTFATSNSSPQSPRM